MRPTRLLGLVLGAGMLWVVVAYGGEAERPSGSEAETAVLALEASTTTMATTTSTTTTTTSTTTTTLPPLILGFAGDTSFTHGLHARDPLGEVAELLAQPDLMAVNLETVVAEPGVGTPYPKEFTFRSPPEAVGLLTGAGVDLVSLANNHTLDFGRPGLLRTLELLEEGGLGYVGAGRNADRAYAPALVEVAGRTLAVLGFSRVLSDIGWAAGPDRPGAASAYDPSVGRTVEAVAAAAEAADLVVVMVHWGIERQLCPQPSQRRLAQQWAEAGAHLVVGSHPHVLQGIERLGETFVIYSTGNFAFPSARQETADSALFLVEVEGGEIGLSLRPLRIVQGRPIPVEGERAEGILSLVSAHSFGWRVAEDGTVVPTNAVGLCGS